MAHIWIPLGPLFSQRFWRWRLLSPSFLSICPRRTLSLAYVWLWLWQILGRKKETPSFQCRKRKRVFFVPLSQKRARVASSLCVQKGNNVLSFRTFPLRPLSFSSTCFSKVRFIHDSGALLFFLFLAFRCTLFLFFVHSKEKSYPERNQRERKGKNFALFLEVPSSRNADNCWEVKKYTLAPDLSVRREFKVLSPSLPGVALSLSLFPYSFLLLCHVILTMMPLSYHSLLLRSREDLNPSDITVSSLSPSYPCYAVLFVLFYSFPAPSARTFYPDTR